MPPIGAASLIDNWQLVVVANQCAHRYGNLPVRTLVYHYKRSLASLSEGGGQPIRLTEGV